MKKHVSNRTFNMINLILSVLVFGTGLVLFIQFHIGGSPYQKAWLGLEKRIWLISHQVLAVGFCIGFYAHIHQHWKYISKVASRWRINLPKRTKSRSRIQILFFIVTLVVLWAGLYPWFAMPGATLDNQSYHNWIDVHNRVGLLLLLGLAVHIIKRRRRLFRFTAKRRGKVNSMKLNGHRTPHFNLDTSKCEACWDCVDECKQLVLGKVDIWFHKHVVVRNAEACRGCQKCIAVCAHGVFRPIPTVSDQTRLMPLRAGRG